MLASVPSATLIGVQGRAISVEVHVSAGIPSFTVVGLPDASCREPRDRVRAAILSSGLQLAPASGDGQPGADRGPQERRGPRSTDRRGPAGCRWPGARRQQSPGLAFLGELGLDGSIRRIPGVLPLVDAVPGGCRGRSGCGCARRRPSFDRARPDARRASAPWSAILRGEEGWPDPWSLAGPAEDPPGPDLADVQGQALGRLAVEVAAAGGHHLLLVGPPGAGKTMLAERLPGLLPPLDVQQALEVTRIHSAAGIPLPPGGLVRRPPMRAPASQRLAGVVDRWGQHPHAAG